jgi:UDP-N-acetylmuramoyl-L-alanyl-D-glutamate--2,6-diaminopimelate ligase
MSSQDPDALFVQLKKNPILKVFYKIPAADWLYQTALALLGAVRYGFPSRKIKVIGVTGTKGKTTTTNIIYSLLKASGKKAAVLSSARIAVGDGTEFNRRGNSMPGRTYIQHFLKKAVDAGCEYAVIEVTSQGVIFSRHRFIRWAVAAITNIAPEHIEAHGSFENYRAAKLSFLRYAANQGAAVFVNQEDEPSQYFGEHLPTMQTIFYSTQGLKELPQRTRELFPGRFNKQNIALAFTILRHFGLSEDALMLALEQIEGVPGRAEFVQREPFAVVVDYAHTPDSLKAIYEAIKEAGTTTDERASRIIGVLGAAGGGRDKWKRPEMGRVAAEHCDDIILTNEDPYDEDPQEILRQIAKGFFPNTVYGEMLDRKEAIFEAIRRARPGDAVVITGKGSEPYMHLANGEVVEWSDSAVVEEFLGNK